MSGRTILWWGRFDPDYSRNRILLQILNDAGWKVETFRPRFSQFGDLEVALKNVGRPDLVWVPCFRQRDIAAARRFSRRKGVPLIVDPLISAYDKQVYEREKFSEDSKSARRLLDWERKLLGMADCVLADTRGHAEFFRDVLNVEDRKLIVVPVGAEEGLFRPAPLPVREATEPLEVLFYGSFISLQGAKYIIEAARVYQGRPVVWTLVGNGPELSECRELAKGLRNVAFEAWIDYSRLPERIGQADILLGVFGASAKAARVIPNKVYQSIACSRPVVTLRGSAYPLELSENSACGFSWVPPGDPVAIAAEVARLAGDRELLVREAAASRRSYDQYLSLAHVRQQLFEALSVVSHMPG